MNCPNCSSEMLPLFTSLYCPVNGGRGCSKLMLELGGRRWRYARVEVGEVVPPWATHAWRLTPHSGSSTEDSTLSADELLARMQSEWRGCSEPGWSIARSHSVAVGKRSPCTLAVFGPVP